jgi:hypothetical protein
VRLRKLAYRQDYAYCHKLVCLPASLCSDDQLPAIRLSALKRIVGGSKSVRRCVNICGIDASVYLVLSALVAMLFICVRSQSKKTLIQKKGLARVLR